MGSSELNFLTFDRVKWWREFTTNAILRYRVGYVGSALVLWAAFYTSSFYTPQVGFTIGFLGAFMVALMLNDLDGHNKLTARLERIEASLKRLEARS